MTSRLYRLDAAGNPVLCDSLEEWVNALRKGTPSPSVAADDVAGMRVSTIFLGVDSGLCDPPMLYETVVFDREAGLKRMRRYPTLTKAKTGHAECVAAVKNGLLD